MDDLPDGIPCKHLGCLNHISHPCEGCGRIGGVTMKLPDDVQEKIVEVL